MNKELPEIAQGHLLDGVGTQAASEPMMKSKMLDNLLLIAENLKLLIFVPLAVALLAWIICWIVPQSYISQAILAVPVQPPPSANQVTQAQSPTQAAAMLTSPLVLDPVIQKLKLFEGLQIDRARKKMTERIRATVSKDNLLRLEVTGTSPEQARDVANALIDQWLKTTVPGEREKSDLQKRLQVAQNSLENINDLLKKLTQDGAAGLARPATRGETGSGLIAVGELQARYLAEAVLYPRLLEGMTHDVVAQVPTLPIDASAPRKELIASGAFAASMLLTLFLLFARHAWRMAANDPLVAQQQRQLLQAIMLGRKTVTPRP